MVSRSYQYISKLAKAIQLIRHEVNANMAITQIAVFLEVVQHEGVTFTELSERLNILSGSMSKNVQQLTKYYTRLSNGTKTLGGYNLVTVTPDLEERRRLACYLTDRGREIAEKLEMIFDGEE